MPSIRDSHLSYLNMAIMLVDKCDHGEAIVNALLDAGGNVNSSSRKGNALALAVVSTTEHSIRMRLCRKLLDNGADPNQIIEVGLYGHGRNESIALGSICSLEGGDCSEPERLELLKLFMDAGADPGIMMNLDSRGEKCNVIHIIVSRRQANVLRCLVSYQKGRDAVNVKRSEYSPNGPENNGDGEVAITMVVANHFLNHHKACRDMAVQLLKAGADPEIKDAIGISAASWLKDPAPKHKELNRLIKKAKGKDPSFWDSDEVKAFIEDGTDDAFQCVNCHFWSDQQQDQTGISNFQRCSKCKRVHCEYTFEPIVEFVAK